MKNAIAASGRARQQSAGQEAAIGVLSENNVKE